MIDSLRFDLAQWLTRIPLAGERRETEARCRATWERDATVRAVRTWEELLAMSSPSARFVVGPHTIAIREQLVAEHACENDLGRAIPVEVFVWGRGEAPRRDATKYGGLPYWPASRPWPERGDDVLTFIGQLAVYPARDLFPEARGDLLLLFARPDDAGGWLDETNLIVQWVDRTEEPLVTEAPASSITPLWAQAHRTHDYPDAAARLPWRESSRLGLITEGTKIGGCPAEIQSSTDLAGYRAAFGSVSVGAGRWPFLDVEQLTHAEAYAPGAAGFGWGDMGSLYVLARSGGIELASACH